MKSFFVLIIFAMGLSATTNASELECGRLANYLGIGPWDYADPSSNIPTGEDPMGRIKRVENVHFTPDMRALDTKKYSVIRLTAEIHYTLRMFPNHPYALHAISKLEKQNGGKLPQSSATEFTPRITADCFFDRALRFRPEDAAVNFIHGIHLHDRRRLQEGLSAYKKAESLGDESPNLHYNLGLLLTELKDWDQALLYANKAYSAGLPLPGLRNRLERAGYKITLTPPAQQTPDQNLSEGTRPVPAPH